MPAAEASQCVEATMPNVPRSSGRVVNPPTRDILGAPRTAPPRDDLSRLDVLVHVEEVAGVVFAFDLREPVVVRAVRRADPIVALLHHHVHVAASRRIRMERLPVRHAPVPEEVAFCGLRVDADHHLYPAAVPLRPRSLIVTDTRGGGNVWLDPELTSPYAFYQYFINVEDALVPQLLRMFTFLDRDEILALEKETAERPAARAGQRRLAEEITRMVHGEAETRQAIAASQALFGRGSLTDLAPATLRAALVEAGFTGGPGGLPPPAPPFQEGGLASSFKDARRTLAEGGAYVNHERDTRPQGGDRTGRPPPGRDPG